MIRALLRALGVHDERPEATTLRFPPTDSELRYECVRQEAEQVIARAHTETDRRRRQLLSYEEFYDDPRRRR